MTKVAIVQPKPGKNNYQNLFDDQFKFDLYNLVDNPDIQKVLKKDVNINIDTEIYDWIILVGSESLKYFTNVTSVTEYSGKVIYDKFLPVINPAMLVFKPEAKKSWEEAKQSIIAYISGEKEKTVISDEDFIGITDEKEALNYIQAAIDYNDTIVAIDTETSSLYPREGYILGISISYTEDKGAYISSDCITDEVINLLQKLFLKKMIIFHNAKFDIAFLTHQFDFEFPFFEDTMLQHYMLDETPGTHGLKQLALKYTKYGDYEKPMYDWIEDFRKKNGILKDDFSFEFIPFEIIKTYAAIDSVVTFLLYKKFKAPLGTNDRLSFIYKQVLIPATRFLIDIQDNGVPFDKSRLVESQDRMLEQIRQSVEELYKFPEIIQFEKDQEKTFNPNSVVQLRKLLFDYLNLRPTGKLTGKGENSTDAEVLTKLSKIHGVPKHILEIRQKNKIKNTYLDKIIPQLNRDSRLRTNFNIHTTVAGRLSSSGKLNMQQLPRDNPIIKGCIKAREGWLIHSVDLQTVEVYVAAVLSNDEALQDIFRQGEDFHSSIAKIVFNLSCDVAEVKTLYPLQRQAAKAVTFGIMYGAGPYKISEQVTSDGGKLSIPQAKKVIDDYFGVFWRLKDWIEENTEAIKKDGYIYSHFGRKRRLPNARSDNRGIQGHEIRSGLNFLVQSVASDINLLGAIDTNNAIKSDKMKTKIFALVHDSILAEVPINEIEVYDKLVKTCLRRNRGGIMIPGAPVGCDSEWAEDYSFGKYEAKYAVAA